MCTTPNDTCLRSFFLKVFFLPFFSGAAAPPAAAGLAIKPQFRLSLRRRLLLLCDRSFARTFTGARVGVRTLSADRQVAAVTESAIGANFDEPLDAHLDFLAQIAFHEALALNYLTDTVDLVL